MRAVNSLYNEGPKETTTVRHICNTRVGAYQTMHTDNDSVSAQQRKNDFLFFFYKKSITFRYIEYGDKRWKKEL